MILPKQWFCLLQVQFFMINVFITKCDVYYIIFVSTHYLFFITGAIAVFIAMHYLDRTLMWRLLCTFEYIYITASIVVMWVLAVYFQIRLDQLQHDSGIHFNNNVGYWKTMA